MSREACLRRPGQAFPPYLPTRAPYPLREPGPEGTVPAPSAPPASSSPGPRQAPRGEALQTEGCGALRQRTLGPGPAQQGLELGSAGVSVNGRAVSVVTTQVCRLW